MQTMKVRFIILMALMSCTLYVGAQCVGSQGQISWHYWENIPYNDIEQLYVDDTYPNGPDKVKKLNSISSPSNYDDYFGSVMKGFISVPNTGAVTFNLTGDDQTVFYLSNNASAAGLDTVALVSNWTNPGEHFKDSINQTSTPRMLTANQLYYFEIHHKEGGWADHVALYWQRPHTSDTTWQLVTTDYLTDVCDPLCPPKGTECDDGNASTIDDIQDGLCNCVGQPAKGSIPVGERGKLEAYFYKDVTYDDGRISTMLADPDFPSMPDSLVVLPDGPNAQHGGSRDYYGTYIQGFLTVPETGQYDFNMTGVFQFKMYLSSDATEANKNADSLYTNWSTDRFEHYRYPHQTISSKTLLAGQYYYFEILHGVGTWGDRFSLFWKGPQHTDDHWHRIPSMYVYDYTDELACLPEGNGCDDGDPTTAMDQIVYTRSGGVVTDCGCEGTPCGGMTGVPCADPEADYVKYDYCETTNALDTRADDAWLSCTPAAVNPHITAHNGRHWIHYDLGDEYELQQMHVWNYNVSGETDKGFQSVSIDYSVDGNTWYHLGNYNWAQAPGNDTYSGFSGPNFNGEIGRYVMITSLDSPSTCRGIGKVNFGATVCPNEGLACDDDDETTLNDHYDDKCACIGYTAAQLNCQIDTLFINESEVGAQTYHAMRALMSEGKVMSAGNVHYAAGQDIILQSGFEVKMGGVFAADIEGCPTSAIALEEKPAEKTLKKKQRPAESLHVYAIDGLTDQTVRFYLPEPTSVYLELLDQKGNKLKSIIRHQYENHGDHYKRLQTIRLEPGVYMIRMTTDSGQYLERMTVL